MARQAKKKPQRKPAPRARDQGRKFWILIAAAIVVLVAALLGVALLRDQNSESDAITQRGVVHVHGLGVNPSDGALYIATHTGMWRISRGGSKPEPIGKSHQDTMGFTIVGANHFLGSGHPDNFNQPRLLGLIESTDSGSSWKPISLLGEADFHVLRAAGTRVYGYDVSQSRLMVSGDGGRTWAERVTRAEVVDLVPNPQAPEQLVAATASGLLSSTNAGVTWKRIGPAVGLLAWPSPGRLYLVTGQGGVLASKNGGRRWSRLGAINGQPAALMARTPLELYAARHDGAIVGSRDGGRTWRVLNS